MNVGYWGFVTDQKQWNAILNCLRKCKAAVFFMKSNQRALGITFYCATELQVTIFSRRNFSTFSLCQIQLWFVALWNFVIFNEVFTFNIYWTFIAFLSSEPLFQSFLSVFQAVLQSFEARECLLLTLEANCNILRSHYTKRQSWKFSILQIICCGRCSNIV